MKESTSKNEGRNKHERRNKPYRQAEKPQASMEQLGEAAAKAAEAMETRSNAENRKHFLEWIDGAFDKGAAGAHRYIRGPAPWCPEAAELVGDASHGLPFNFTASPDDRNTDGEGEIG